MKTFDWRTIEEAELDALPDGLVSELIDRRINDAPNTPILRQVFDALSASPITTNAHPLPMYELAVDIAGMVTPLAAVQTLKERGKAS